MRWRSRRSTRLVFAEATVVRCGQTDSRRTDKNPPGGRHLVCFPLSCADFCFVTLLQQRDARRRAARLNLWDQTRHSLQAALSDLLPCARVFVYGSLTQRGVFNPASDIDLALTEDPQGKTIWLLQAQLEERLRRPVDLVLLNETRLRDKILREGEEWMT